MKKLVQNQTPEPPIILMVDDEAHNLILLKDTLAAAECRLRIATNGRDALKSIQLEAPDLILVDIVMPEMDGFTLCEELKKEESTRDIPLIFLSGHDHVSYKVKAFELGGVDYILKPFQAAEVLARVKTHLQLSRLMKELAQEVSERQGAQVALQEEIKRRRLSEASEKQQRILAEALLDTAIVLTSTLDFDEVIDRILKNIDTVIDFDSCLVFLLNDHLGIVAQRGYSRPGITQIQEWASAITTLDGDLLLSAETSHVVTRDNDAALNPFYAKLAVSQSNLIAPVLVKGNIIGLLLLGSDKVHHFQIHDVRVMEIFAQQVGVAIENAKHHAQVRQLTILEERNRIARDLHDTISQNLWSMKIVADTLPQLWDREQQIFWDNVEHLGIVAQTTLAEMRSLLLELQPQFLEETPLVKLIENLKKSVASKLGIDILFECNAAEELSNEVKIVFYRMAQESLNNIMRHANAENITITLQQTAAHLELTVFDDGVGFDLADIPPGHLGIKTMTQRAEGIGAQLAINSDKDEGTTVKLRWALPEEDNQ